MKTSEENKWVGARTNSGPSKWKFEYGEDGEDSDDGEDGEDGDDSDDVDDGNDGFDDGAGKKRMLSKSLRKLSHLLSFKSLF